MCTLKSLVKKCVAFYVRSLFNAECNRITVKLRALWEMLRCHLVMRIWIEKIVTPHVVQEVHSIIVFCFVSYLRVTLLMRPNLVTDNEKCMLWNSYVLSFVVVFTVSWGNWTMHGHFFIELQPGYIFYLFIWVGTCKTNDFPDSLSCTLVLGTTWQMWACWLCKLR